ncbi:MAG: cytochrome c [Xanthobacteraceae bacterium]|nr:cytochrome c [Xanthobacteraceae bacterium]
MRFRPLLIAAAAVPLVAGLAVTAVSLFTDEVRALLGGTLAAKVLRPALPPVPTAKQARWLDQNWTNAQRHWFHHAPQGTSTFPVPYEWFVALEQPEVNFAVFPAGLLKEPGYLERFGFIPSPRTLETDSVALQKYGYSASSSAIPVSASVPHTSADNLDGLPVGFARTPGYADPVTGERLPDQVGFTCAACHTGHLTYKGVSLRYDGGPAMADLGRLEQAIGLSIFYTRYLPFRFDRFARRVLGADADRGDVAKLSADLDRVLDVLKGRLEAAKILDARSEADPGHAEDRYSNTEEGFGRLDALNRIGNQVFFENLRVGTKGDAKAPLRNLGSDDNLAVLHAPVSFPPIWDAPRFLWAQYDASILQPLVRNAGEALGVAAKVNMVTADRPKGLFRSSVVMGNLHQFETMLAGKSPFEGDRPAFKGLRAPKWPEGLFRDDPAWRIDPARVVEGRKLYRAHCAECHLGPVADPVFDADYPDVSIWAPKWWRDVGPDGDRRLDVVQKPVSAMGTDKEQSDVLAKRMVVIPPFLGIDPAADLLRKAPCERVPPAAGGKVPFATALMDVVDRVVGKWFEDHPEEEVRRGEIVGPLPNCPNPKGAVYRARPLDGVWATAPYLHNGSVPSLRWMLTPAGLRPKSFCIGAREFDPLDVGLRVEVDMADCARGEFRFDASKIGNGNRGHSFEGTGKERPDGVLGPELTESERLALIEYLKTL